MYEITNLVKEAPEIIVVVALILYIFYLSYTVDRYKSEIERLTTFKRKNIRQRCKTTGRFKKRVR